MKRIPQTAFGAEDARAVSKLFPSGLPVTTVALFLSYAAGVDVLSLSNLLSADQQHSFAIWCIEQITYLLKSQHKQVAQCSRRHCIELLENWTADSNLAVRTKSCQWAMVELPAWQEYLDGGNREAVREVQKQEQIAMLTTLLQER